MIPWGQKHLEDDKAACTIEEVLSPSSTIECKPAPCYHLTTLPLPYVMVTINDIPVKALIDTGAATSIVQRSFLTNNGSPDQKIEPDDVTLVGPNNVSIETFGKTKLDVDLGGESFQTHVVVADISQLLILGNDFLRRHKMVLDFEKQSLNTHTGGNLQVLAVSEKHKDHRYPAYSAKTCIINPGQQQSLPIHVPLDFPKEQDIMFVPLRDLDFSCSILPHICRGPQNNEKTFDILINNAHHEPIMIEQYQEIGHLTEGPVSSEVKYLQSCSATGVINEVKPLDISPEEDCERWLTLLKTLKEDSWEISPEQRREALKMLYKYRFLFALKNEPWGLCDQVYHTIDVQPGTAPIKQKPRPVPPAHREELEQIINDLLERGLIEETAVPWASPVVLVKKADSTLRFVYEKAREELKALRAWKLSI